MKRLSPFLIFGLILLAATASCTNLMQKNQFLELNQHILTFSPINFTVWSHKLSIDGDALTLCCYLQKKFKLLEMVELTSTTYLLTYLRMLPLRSGDFIT